MKFRVWKSYKIIEVEGSSMFPSLKTGWYLLFKTKNIEKIKRKEIILHFQEGKWLIKRIIGLSNEFIQIQNNSLLVNNTELQEDYLLGPRNSETISQWQLGSNEYVILGDNSNDSLDSRKFGSVNLPQNLFALKRRIWPLFDK
ncbi:MAG: Signal peptidase IB [Candidatus Heimdallarchaeota archaeon LC_2]|nr:MAG: Signal peptidase IB [Candidatus Heimdallarchaeota archaeon LC_2]